MNHYIKADENLNLKIEKCRLGLLEGSVRVAKGDTSLWEIINLTTSEIKNRYELQEINKQEIIHSTRQAYKKAGNDPNRYRPSADSLMRRIVKEQGLYKVNNVVDILNYISITSGFSIGGYDSDNISGPIIFGIGLSGEPYQGIGRGNLNIENLPVLRDDIGAFGTPTSDSQRTMITQKTQNILMVFFDFGFHDALEPNLQKAVDLLVKYCNSDNAKYRTEIMN